MSEKQTRTRRRLDGVAETVTKPVEVSTLVEPKFLTLCGKPANQVAFKIVRGDVSEEEDMSKEVAVNAIPRRVRPAKRSSLLTIEFPEGSTEDDVKEVVEKYGLEGYEMVENGDKKCLTLRRSDLTVDPEKYVSVTLAGGLRAKVARSDSAAAETSTMQAISVVAIEFAKEQFDEAGAMEIIQRFDIDILENGVENTDNLIRVVRTEVGDGAEVRRVEIQQGVTVVVARADTPDLGSADPAFIEVVSETAYGNWGWGQLDFAASMADVEFCNAAEDATYRLSRVMSNILYYSELPVAVRKQLVTRAAGQFAEYIGSLLDGLPTKVVIVNRSHEEKKVAQVNTGSTQAPKATTAPAAEQPEYVTRADLQAVVTEAVTAALAARDASAAKASEGTTQRSDGTAGEGDAAAGAQGGEGEGTTGASSTQTVVEQVTRSVSEAMTTALSGIAARLDKIESATVVRSDGPDSDTQAGAVQRDVFAGIFGGAKQS